MCRKYDLVDTGKVRAVKRASSLRSWSLTKVYKTRNRLAKSEELYAIRSNTPYISNQLAYYFIIFYYRYSAFGPVWAETRALSGDWYGSGTLHPGQVLRGSLPLLFPAFRRSHFRHQVPPRPPRCERSPAAEVGTVGEKVVQ